MALLVEVEEAEGGGMYAGWILGYPNESWMLDELVNVASCDERPQMIPLRHRMCCYTVASNSGMNLWPVHFDGLGLLIAAVDLEVSTVVEGAIARYL
ncbi:hypothetical protein PHISCL_02387 [Aspergillus sclerotialis]|uniref:Uncharacterized protein n=1 Tax=Aspergillus sclerotialis TaxID=2070753 RepID=A0A3A2ZQ63_9EURO|nr:hypothetical protein PHISCL_02387 [Aspergillus sclerotialis]